MPATINRDQMGVASGPLMMRLAPSGDNAEANWSPGGFDIPLSVPRSQAYFWTERWQAGEREADADIQAGRLTRFSNAEDAILWLLTEED